MSQTAPDHNDAALLFRAYELRREPVMRESRNAITAKFLPQSFADIVAISQWTHPMNAAWRQVSSYWEMVYNMVRHGVVHPEYFMESNGEGLLLYAKVEPWLKEFRDQFSQTAFRNAEWVATHTTAGREILARFRPRIEAARKAAAEAARTPAAGSATPKSKRAGAARRRR